jgi:FkbM family methyltransferase
MIIYKEKKAYDTISRDIECNFHTYINKTKEQIKLIVIVGGYHCYEAKTFLRNYPNATIHIFEPVLEYFNVANNLYGSESRCVLHNYAISDFDGVVDFYRTSSQGSDSLLKVVENNKSGYKFKSIQSEKVVCKKLRDVIFDKIDLLSVDVQGAELKVLRGCDLDMIESMFLEIQMSENNLQIVYEGQCFMDDLKHYLHNKFSVHSIGLDNEMNNGTGNSFWIKVAQS